MAQFVIILNQIEGVDLILKALQSQYTEKGCLASFDLHAGIMKNLHLLEDDLLIPLQPPVVDTPEEPEPKKFPALTLVPNK